MSGADAAALRQYANFRQSRFYIFSGTISRRKCGISGKSKESGDFFPPEKSGDGTLTLEQADDPFRDLGA
jgi:hypothetical protein